MTYDQAGPGHNGVTEPVFAAYIPDLNIEGVGAKEDSIQASSPMRDEIFHTVMPKVPDGDEIGDSLPAGTLNTLLRYGNTIIGGTLVGSTLIALVLEQTPANESFRLSQGMDVLKHGGSPFDVMVRTIVITSLVELGLGTLVAVGINRKDGMMGRALDAKRERVISRESARAERVTARKLQKNEGKAEEQTAKAEVESVQDRPGRLQKLKFRVGRQADMYRETPYGLAAGFATAKANEMIRAQKGKGIGKAANYIATSLFVGSGIVVADEYVESDENSFLKSEAHAAAASGIIVTASGAIAYLLAGGADWTKGTSIETPVAGMVDLLTDQKVWTALGAAYIGNRIRRWGADVYYERQAKTSEDQPASTKEEKLASATESIKPAL